MGNKNTVKTKNSIQTWKCSPQTTRVHSWVSAGQKDLLGQMGLSDLSHTTHIFHRFLHPSENPGAQLRSDEKHGGCGGVRAVITLVSAPSTSSSILLVESAWRSPGRFTLTAAAAARAKIFVRIGL
jgi:hypothetical protein